MSLRLCPGRHSQTLGLFLPFSLSTGEQTEAEIRAQQPWAAGKEDEWRCGLRRRSMTDTQWC